LLKKKKKTKAEFVKKMHERIKNTTTNREIHET